MADNDIYGEYSIIFMAVFEYLLCVGLCFQLCIGISQFDLPGNWFYLQCVDENSEGWE